MNLRIPLAIFSLWSGIIYGANVNVTTFYGKTGGILGKLNTVGEVGRYALRILQMVVIFLMTLNLVIIIQLITPMMIVIVEIY